MDFKFDENGLYFGDCLEQYRKNIERNSIALILTDLPYGTTACKWDSILPFDKLWEMVNYLLKPKGTFITTASQPFTSALVMSNPKQFKFAWVWDKKFGANFVQAKRQPIKTHEDVLIFTKGGMQPNYYPQMIKRDKPIKKGGNKQSDAIPIARTPNAKLFGEQGKEYNEKYPTSIIQFDVRKDRGLHPTQKPVALMEYLIKTYSNEFDFIFDPCAGSASTLIACENTNRNYFGYEKNEEIYKRAKNRLDEYIKRIPVR